VITDTLHSTSRATPSGPARATVLAAATLTLMAAAIISPSLPAMATEFAHTPGVDLLVRLAVTVTSLAIAISAPVSGVIADRVGRRPLLVFGLVLYATSGTVGYFIADLHLLLVSRVSLGIAVGAIMTAVSATITDWFDGPGRAVWLGRQQAAASVGGVVFLPLAGILATLNWRAPFWIYAVSAFVALAAVIAMPGRPRPAGTQETDRLLIATDRRRVAGVYALASVATVAFFMAPTQLPFLLADRGASPGVVGAVVAASMLTGVLGAVSFPRLRKHMTTQSITAINVGLLGVGWWFIGSADSVAGVLAGLLVGGFGVGAVVPNLNLRLGELADPRRRGRVLGGLVSAIFAGQFLSPLVVAPLITSIGIAGTFTAAGIAMAFGAAAAAVVHGMRSHHLKGRNR
jgi:MFS family permease